MRTNSQKERSKLATETGSKTLNEENKTLLDTLDSCLSSAEKDKLVSNICEFGNLLDACQENDKESLVKQIMEQARVRGMKPGKGVERNLMKQDFTYLHNFAFTQLANIADDYTKRNGAQKLSTWQYIAQLLNLRTSARNIVSNTAFYGVNGLARNIAAPVDMLTSLFTKKRTTNFSTFNRGEESRHAAAMDRATRSWLETRLDVDVGTNQGKYGEGSRRTFKVAQKGIGNALGRALSQLEKVNGYSLNVSDEFFKGAIYQSSINSYARLVANGMMTQEEAENFATQDMLYATFQDDTKVGDFLNALHNGANRLFGFGNSEQAVKNKTHDFGAGDIICKYRGVPGALVTRAIEFSPAGYLKAIYNLGKLVKSGGTDTTAQRNFALNVGRATTGSGLVALFTTLALKGIIRREENEDDKNVAAMDRAQGLGSTQINLDAIGRWISGESTEWQDGDDLLDIGFLDPVSSTITMGTMLANMMEAEGADRVTEALKSNWSMAVAAFGDLSMMDTINDIIYAAMYHDDESDLSVEGDVLITLATSTLTGFEPSLLRQIAQATDNNYRDVYGGGKIADMIGGDTGAALQTAANSLMVNIPGLRQQVPTKLDNMGEEKTYADNTLVNAVNALLNPGKYAKYSQSALQRELKAVYDSTGDASFYPARNGASSVNFGSAYAAGSIQLTDQQKRAYLQDTGEMYQKFAAEVMGQDYYQNATANERAEMLKEVKSYAEYSAKQKLWETLHGKDKDYTPYENSTWTKLESVMDLGIGMGEAYGLVQDMSEIKADTDADGNTVTGSQEGKLLSYLDGLGYDDETKIELYEISRGSDGQSAAKTFQALLGEGLDFTDIVNVKKAYTDYRYNDANTSNLKDVDAYDQWLYDNGFDQDEVAAVNEALPFWTMIKQENDSVLTRLVDEGMDYDDAFEIANMLKGIDPEDDADYATTKQKYSAIVDDNAMTSTQKRAALAAIQGNQSMFGDLSEGVAENLMDLYGTSGTGAVLNMNVSTYTTVDGERYDYSDSQKDAYKEAYLEIMDGLGSETVTSTDALAYVKEIASNAGKYAAYEEGGFAPDIDSSDYSIYRKALQAQTVGLGYNQYAEIKQTCDNFTADKKADGTSISGTKKKKVVAYLKGLGLTTQQYDFFYTTVMGYK